MISTALNFSNEFKDRFHNELTRRKIKHYYGVPGKPASQSMVERLNQTIKGKLKRLWRARGVLAAKPWNDSTIQAVVASYNDQVHSALPKGVTPTGLINHGRRQALLPPTDPVSPRGEHPI
eukprot:COSAG03_NODE_14771_length_452_cov_334.515581_1_plen_121_part_00